MKRFEKLLLNGSGYTILILTIFYTFINIADFDRKTIGVERFLLILGFGMIISLAETVYDLFKFKKILKCFIHYALLLTAFSIIFIAGEFFTINGPASVFVAVTIFTVFYFAIWLIVHFVRKGVVYADRKIDSRLAKKSDKNKMKEEKNEYKPLYK